MHLIDYYRKMIDVKKYIVNILQQGAFNWLLQEKDRCKKIVFIFCSSVHLIVYYRKIIDVKKKVNILQQGALNWLLQENDRFK